MIDGRVETKILPRPAPPKTKFLEKGKNNAEYIHNVFNSDGVFITRVSMPAYGSWIYPGTKLNRANMKNRRFYCIREKESGYKEFVVYRMKWEN
jgi:hypothetical protein